MSKSFEIFYLTSDNGDGSSSVHFFKDKGYAKEVMQESEDSGDDNYWANEGCVGVVSFSIDENGNPVFPKGFFHEADS